MNGARAEAALPEPSRALGWFNAVLWLVLGSSVVLPLVMAIGWLTQTIAVNFKIGKGELVWPAVIFYLGYIYVLFGLRNLVGDALRGQVFTAHNVWRLRRAGWLIFWYAMFVHVVTPIVKAGGISSTFTFAFSTTMFLNWFTAALAVLSVAEVFRQGVVIRQTELRLRQEQELTV